MYMRDIYICQGARNEITLVRNEELLCASGLEHNQFLYFGFEHVSAASQAVENAACRLYPPVLPSTSITSPQK